MARRQETIFFERYEHTYNTRYMVYSQRITQETPRETQETTGDTGDIAIKHPPMSSNWLNQHIPTFDLETYPLLK